MVYFMKKLVLIIIPIIIFIIVYIFSFHISFNNIENVVVNVFDNYTDKLPTACYKNIFNKCVKNIEVTSLGNVDTNKVGKYEITYTAKNKQVKKIINVIDNESPVIKTDENDIIACPGAKDILVSYTATDNYDENLKVNKIIKDDKLILEATDSSGNKTTITKNIKFIDNENPKINLKGDKRIYLQKGNKYTEPGYEAIDNCLGNITDSVVISNNIDINKNGEYEVKYEVTDGFNKTIEKRTIYVYEKNPDISIGNKVIYLTFDDGPSVYTNELLNVLKEYNVKATFFVTGNGNKEYIKRAYNEGHSIGIHTYSHVYKKIYASEEAYFDDLEKVQKIIKEQTGEETRLVRFPGGSSNTVSRFNKGIMTRLSKELERRGYKYFDWNVSSSDTVKSNSDDIANTVIKNLKKGNNVVLQHDTKYYSVKAVRKIIEYGLANGYTFAKLDLTSPTIHHGINN